MASTGKVSSIQNQPLDITVVGCSRLRDKEWFSRQDPYVCLEYANSKFRTKTCTDGGKNPTFNEKFVLPLVEGLREINIAVWNSNTLSHDDLIGTGKIYLEKVLTSGYDDSPWPLLSRNGKNAGDVRIILHFANAKTAGVGKASTAFQSTASVSSSGHAPYPQYQPYPSYAPPGYAPSPSAYPSAPAPYPPPSVAYPYAAAPTQAYPPPTYPPSTYPPSTYPPAYPPPPGYPGYY